MRQTRNSGVFEDKKKRSLFTLNLTPGKRVYDERLVSFDGKEYREWNPRKSKIGAALTKGMGATGIKEGARILYLGAASGTTVSHVSDIVGSKGLIFAVDLSARVLRELVMIAETRNNIVPILEDAHKIDDMAQFVTECDVLFQDVAQKDQVAIFLKNCIFLKKGGYALISVKARSISVSDSPKKIFASVEKELRKHMEVVQSINLHPFEKDHCLIVCKK